MFQSESKTWNIHNLIDKTGHMKKVILVIHVFHSLDATQRPESTALAKTK